MEPTTDDETLLLPEGTRLLHIGPHKTGTTAIQAALWAARDDLLAQGVRHAGRSRNPASAVRAVTGQPSPFSTDRPPPMWHWRDLVRELATAREPRVVVSSEFFAWATPEVIHRIVHDVDPARVHVAVTVRPLARILPSQWQQNVQGGTVTSFDQWLATLFRASPAKKPPFWTLHRHHELLARWAGVVGPERVTAIVVHDRDHGVVLRAFEWLLGLREGTLKVVPDLVNRSLSLPEAEAIRAFNLAFKAEGLPKSLHARIMRFGTAQTMTRQPIAPDDPRVELPAWVIDDVANAAAEIVAGIKASGVRVIGDLDLLTRVPAPGTDPPERPAVRVSPETAAAMAMGILVATGAAREARRGSGRFQYAEPIELAMVPTYQLATTVVSRARVAAVRRLRRAGRTLRPG